MLDTLHITLEIERDKIHISKREYPIRRGIVEIPYVALSEAAGKSLIQRIYESIKESISLPQLIKIIRTTLAMKHITIRDIAEITGIPKNDVRKTLVALMRFEVVTKTYNNAWKLNRTEAINTLRRAICQHIE